MPTPTIPAGNLFMNATLYTGNGGTQTITNGVTGQSFQPDFVWYKNRSIASAHNLFDSVRGVNQYLISNSTAAEGTASGVTSFNTNGFSVGSLSNGNGSGNSIVGWQWKAGGTAVSNTDGTITSSVSANQTSGFSVVTFTTQASGTATVGHGLSVLGVAPSLIIVKIRSIANAWNTYNKESGAGNYLQLNTTAAQVADATLWNNTAPTSSVFSLGAPWAGSYTTVAYCWAPIAGYSAFGSYTGNGAADGPFVYLGFRPRWVLWKRSSGVGDWILQDTSRSTYNASDTVLFPNYSDAETTGGGYPFDILSNGFKLRNSATYANASGSTYIYAAFAENPFKYANAR
jgi:hypothetical protein